MSPARTWCGDVPIVKNEARVITPHLDRLRLRTRPKADGAPLGKRQDVVEEL
jgi:hypothetical protein